MAKQVQLSEITNSKLDEISEKRQERNELICNKKSIVADLIDKEYKKESKK